MWMLKFFGFHEHRVLTTITNALPLPCWTSPCTYYCSKALAVEARGTDKRGQDSKATNFWSTDHQLWWKFSFSIFYKAPICLYHLSLLKNQCFWCATELCWTSYFQQHGWVSPWQQKVTCSPWWNLYQCQGECTAQAFSHDEQLVSKYYFHFI